MIVVSHVREAILASSRMENNPFVTGENLARKATLSGSNVLDNGARENAVTGTTADYWRPAVSETIRSLVLDFGEVIGAQFAAVAAHNLGTLGALVRVQHSPDNTAWTTAGSFTPENDNPIAFRFLFTERRYWRLVITGQAITEAVAVGVFYLGNEIICPARTYQGFRPVITPTNVRLQSNVSQGGNLLGSSVVQEGSSIRLALEHIPSEFIRSAEWIDFQRGFNRGRPAFFAWRPAKYPQDLHYVWRDGGVIEPDNTGPRDMMSFQMDARAYDG